MDYDLELTRTDHGTFTGRVSIESESAFWANGGPKYSPGIRTGIRRADPNDAVNVDSDWGNSALLGIRQLIKKLEAL
jgi:hypothetical protein